MCARRHLGEILSAFEFLDRAALKMTLQQLPNIQNPLPESDVRVVDNPTYPVFAQRYLTCSKRCCLPSK